jgi:hypothetical protein
MKLCEYFPMTSSCTPSTISSLPFLPNRTSKKSQLTSSPISRFWNFFFSDGRISNLNALVLRLHETHPWILPKLY